jgi:hypothetical protein
MELSLLTYTTYYIMAGEYCTHLTHTVRSYNLRIFGIHTYQKLIVDVSLVDRIVQARALKLNLYID